MVPDSWVLRAAPAALRPYLQLARVDRPIGTWLLLFPCWWSYGLALTTTGPLTAQPWQAWLPFAGFALGALVMRGAGCTINDLADREIDAKVARTATRPLPSGRVTLRQALGFLLIQLLIGLLVLVQFNGFTILVGLAAMALVVPYPFMKRITYWPQAWLGFTFNWGALVGWAAAHGALEAPALLLYAGGIAWTLGYDTIYAHQDKEDDALIGVRSSALRLGAATRPWLLVFYGLALVLFLAAGAAAGAAWPFLARCSPARRPLPLADPQPGHRRSGQLPSPLQCQPRHRLDPPRRHPRRRAGAVTGVRQPLFGGDLQDPRAFVRANTVIAATPLVPEIRLHLASEVVPLWQATEAELAATNLPPPFWAFAWAGGQALARYLLDHPEVVRGKRVLDFAAGSGQQGIAAMLAGAAHLEAAEDRPLRLRRPGPERGRQPGRRDRHGRRSDRQRCHRLRRDPGRRCLLRGAHGPTHRSLAARLGMGRQAGPDRRPGAHLPAASGIGAGHRLRRQDHPRAGRQRPAQRRGLAPERGDLVTLTEDQARALIAATTAPHSPPLLPEITLRCAKSVVDIGRYLQKHQPGGFPPGFYWAFPWTGGQLLARHLLDNPALVAGKRVLDFACGSGLIGIAAARAGAASVMASDIDPIAALACSVNAEANGVAVEATANDLMGEVDAGWDLLLVGDIYYHDRVAPKATAWFQDLVEEGVEVLVGDPGRPFLPREALRLVCEAAVEPHPAIADVESGRAWVWQVEPH